MPSGNSGTTSSSMVEDSIDLRDLAVIDLRDLAVIDLRAPRLAPMTWAESASLVEYPQDLDGRIADQWRDSLDPEALHTFATEDEAATGP